MHLMRHPRGNAHVMHGTRTGKLGEMWLKLIECSFPFARPLGVKLRCCVRRSGVLALCAA